MKEKYRPMREGIGGGYAGEKIRNSTMGINITNHYSIFINTI